MTYMSKKTIANDGRAVEYLQDEACRLLNNLDYPPLRTAKLVGGTALSRFWLQHRQSRDMDYFLPAGFSALDLARDIKRTGLRFETLVIVDGKNAANQLDGYLRVGQQAIKVSFVEDAYYEVYPAIRRSLGGQTVLTESIEGLYHRKLRTITGHTLDQDTPAGGRQKARDIFDLCVLSEKHAPFTDFVKTIPYEFPTRAFINGLAAIRWFDLIDELSEITAAPQWQKYQDIGVVRQALFAQTWLEADMMVASDTRTSPSKKPAHDQKRRGPKP